MGSSGIKWSQVEPMFGKFWKILATFEKQTDMEVRRLRVKTGEGEFQLKAAPSDIERFTLTN